MSNIMDRMTIDEYAQHAGHDTTMAVHVAVSRGKAPPSYKLGRNRFFPKAGVFAYEKALALGKTRDAAYQAALDAIEALD